jgi:hypothetical protein
MVRFYALERISKTLGSPKKNFGKAKILGGGTPLGALEPLPLPIREVPLFGGAVMRDF